MHPILAIFLAALQMTTYVAKRDTFACTSIEDVSKLREVRNDQVAYHREFGMRRITGLCIGIAEGSLYDGELEPEDATILKIGRQVLPPGYETPLEDFEIKNDLK